MASRNMGQDESGHTTGGNVGIAKDGIKKTNSSNASKSLPNEKDKDTI